MPTICCHRIVQESIESIKVFEREMTKIQFDLSFEISLKSLHLLHRLHPSLRNNRLASMFDRERSNALGLRVFQPFCRLYQEVQPEREREVT